ncbi:unnamed protein product, partial [marine sediment metagenome]
GDTHCIGNEKEGIICERYIFFLTIKYIIINMSFEKPYIEGEEEEEEDEEQPLIPLEEQMNFFRIDISSNPQFNLAILDQINGGKIIANKGGSFTRWNYNTIDKTISSYSDPSYVIASKSATIIRSQLYSLDKTTAAIYKKWTWNPSTNTFTLDANPKLMMAVDGTVAPSSPIVLLDNTAKYNKFNIVLPSPDMPNISIAPSTEPTLFISAAHIPNCEQCLSLGDSASPFIIWNYENMVLST